VLCNAGLMHSTDQSLTMHCVRAGGRGKSTLAKVLFNRLAGSFPHSAFVEIQEGDGADKTANHLAAALKGLGASGEAAEGAAVLCSRLKECVRDRKVLLVLDNVWTGSQLNALLPTALGEGSTVIITSRSARFTDSDTWRKVCRSMMCMHVWQRSCDVGILPSVPCTRRSYVQSIVQQQRLQAACGHGIPGWQTPSHAAADTHESVLGYDVCPLTVGSQCQLSHKERVATCA
jgi:hypothetical protein